MSRHLARDYKRGRSSSGFDFSRWREFAVGLGIGLLVALALFVYQRDALDRASKGADVPRPEPRAAGRKPRAGDGSDPGAEEAGRQYDFYEMLPKFEVVVPEKEREVRPDAPASPIERPGVYVLQAGSYRRFEDAERIRAQLALQGVDATVQRVAVDTDVWHRVRIGPVNDLRELNRLRTKLRSADLDALVIRVGD
ncbi:MAG: SPOR domain-containing protein [Steroidobacteraceae bacterium]